ncbi:D-xylose 1-dehydrogenase [Aureococcus anophagefferens]|nr:D-xylose 1-dehydrogenase [Aureococcus anophagefferens]
MLATTTPQAHDNGYPDFTPLRLGLLGLSPHSRTLVDAARQSQRCAIVAAAVRDEKRLAAWGEEEDLAGVPHMVWCCAAAKMHKHVLVEKPLAGELSDALVMRRACEEDVVLMDSAMFPYHERTEQILTEIRNPRDFGEWLEVVGDHKVLTCDDFVIPRFAKDCAYTVESFPWNSSPLVDLHSCVVAVKNETRVLNAHAQRVRLLDTFADLCLELFDGRDAARKTAMDDAVLTQALVSCLVESCRQNGALLSMGDTSPSTATRTRRRSSFPASAFLDYEALKKYLYELETQHLREPLEENALSAPAASGEMRDFRRDATLKPARFRAPNLGLSVTPATNAAAQPVSYDDDDDGDDGRLLTRRMSARQSVTHETFLTTLDDELKKMDTFAREVVAVRAELRALEAVDADAAAADGDAFDGRVAACGETFLEVERYVNVNVTAVRKLLKKHDKVLPQRPIKAFYTARMHDMRWGGRGGAESKDSQLVNSVYLDSSTLELYHGRLNKLPGAVALRLRWYGTGEPRLCHRTAFQLSHTNAVRASIDTNLCLISEVQGEDPLEAAKEPRWYRDASKNIPRNEITRFPFAVLELKLAMDETDDLPDWLRPLVDSDGLAPVHKFSKFVHGCAVLLPDEVQAMPYWIDDPALAPSIRATGVGATLLRKTSPGKAGAPPLEKWTEPSAQWTDPRKLAAARAVPRQRRLDSASRLYAEGCCGVELPELDGRLCEGSDCFGRDLDVRGGMQQPLPRQRVEPKLHFANERTFVHWLHAAVVLVSFGAAAYGVADSGGVAAPAGERRARRR